MINHLCYLLLISGLAATAADKVDFNKDIRPILSDKCFHCHGPDEHDRKGKLRLDVPHGDDGAFREKKGTFAIKPGDPAASEIWKRIITDDEDDVMPPADSTKKALTAEEKALVKKWIEQGAQWQEHWSFNPIEMPEIPKVTEHKNWAKNEVDHFVLDELKKHGLKPTTEAPRYKLIRRAYLDLIGLYPTPEEVKAFKEDKSPNAYEKVIDRLLADKRYGERMTLKWLDISRYGDTSVYHADGPRTMWPWRDWVIEAYNSNKPFNEFTIEQLAGDHIPNATPRQKMATGFLRNNGTTDEGGAFDEEYRVEYTVDRLALTSTVWLGLTMECAQCHDHKYDPVSQKEFFQMYAFFNVSADKGMQTRRGNAEPKMKVPPSEMDQQQIDEYKAEIAKHREEMEAYRQDNASKAESWIAENLKKHGHSSTVEGLQNHFPLDEANGKQILDTIDTKNAAQVQGRIYGSKRDKEPAVHLKGNDNYFSKTAGEFIDNTTPFSYGGWVKQDNVGGFKAILARMDSKNKYRGYDLFTSNGQFGVHLINSWAANAIKIQSEAKMQNKKWHHVFATYDGTGKAAGFKLYLDGKEVPFKVLNDNLTATTKTKIPFRIGRREVGANFSGFLDDIRIYNRVLDETDINLIMKQDSAAVIFSKAALSNGEIDKEFLRNYYFTKNDKTYQGIQKKIKGVNDKIDAILNRDVMIMTDMNVPRKTYILNRGAYDQPMKNKEIKANTPDILPPMKDDMPKNRLGLAQWIMDKDNPLTARVTVNRYWSMFFGKGIVSTVTDFGSQGAWPSHPDLLDYLAADFRDNGWNVKRTIKKILMSATYRQDSVISEALVEKDAENNFLARGPRFRLQGDLIRDNALYVSGLLYQSIGGAGTKPYQPDGLWKEVALSGNVVFKRDSGEKLYRRSMYIYWKRSAPHPAMVTFDAPTREKCVVQRSRTNTPLQALVTLNDEQFVEAARFFGERIMKEGGKTNAEKIDWAFSLVTSRKPATQIRQKIEALFEDQLKHFTENPENAKLFLSVGEKKRDESLNLAQHAAWSVIAKLMLNMDETINKE